MTTTTLKGFAPAGHSLAARAWHQLVSLFAAAKPAVRSRAEEAAEVRAMARAVHATDPGFAADLYAAADRHELHD